MKIFTPSSSSSSSSSVRLFLYCFISLLQNAFLFFPHPFWFLLKSSSSVIWGVSA